MPLQTHGGERLIELDSLRGIAGAWVMVFHYTWGVDHLRVPDGGGVTPEIAPFSVNIEGLLAVHLFFIISGFVIFMTLDRCVTVKDFAVLRFARLYPAYWACLAMTCLATALMPLANPEPTLRTIIANATMLQDFLGVPSIDSVYWSLPYELSFYVMMGVLFHLRLTGRIEILGAAWLIVCLVAFKAFPSVGDLVPSRIRIVAGFPFTPLFLFGVVLFRVATHGVTPGRVLLCAACYVTTIWDDGPRWFWIHTAIFAAFPLAVFGQLPVLRWRPLVFLGTISYSLYLLHNEIGMRVQWSLVSAGWRPWTAFAVAVCGSLALASAVTFGIEAPARRRIREAFRPAFGRRAAAAGAAVIELPPPPRNPCRTIRRRVIH